MRGPKEGLRVQSKNDSADAIAGVIRIEMERSDYDIGDPHTLNSYFHWPGPPPGLDKWHWDTSNLSRPADNLQFSSGRKIPWHGFAYERNTYAHKSVLGTSTRISFPYWSLFFAVSAGPWLLLSPAILRSHRRRRRGLCPSCGYDLRATPGRCPECGRAPAPAAAKIAENP
jgi:hypothetical protein